ncbi:MAG TPA: hypothetical protein VMS96_13155 [Terriglobales bacterium]|nr:hypothetical protein [Terriglobales bacterium]
MVSLASLWLPIVLSAVIVFIASSILHMALKYHQGDYRQLPEEDNLRAALRSAGVTRGLYMFPYCKHDQMKSAEMAEKWKQGPNGMVIILPTGMPQMPKFLGQWFGYLLLMSFFIAYLAAHTMAAGTPYLHVFRVVGTAGFIGYGLANITNGIWRGHTGSMVMKDVIDGLVYGLLTAGTFGWLWPK